MTKLAYVVMVLAGVGALLCLSLYLFSVTGIFTLPSEDGAALFAGIFLVWVPTILLMNRLTWDFKQKDLWTAALRGYPSWMRNTLWVVIGCVFAVSFISLLSKENLGEAPDSFVLFPITFYAVAFCVMYSFIQAEKQDPLRRCLNGHSISPLAKFCEECGAPAATRKCEA